MNIKQAMKLVAKATALAANGSGNCAQIMEAIKMIQDYVKQKQQNQPML